MVALTEFPNDKRDCPHKIIICLESRRETISELLSRLRCLTQRVVKYLKDPAFFLVKRETIRQIAQ